MTKLQALKNRKIQSVLALASIAFASNSHAALQSDAAGAFTSITTAIADTASAAWPVIAAGIVAVITVKLVKRFSRFV